jgi:predicted MFS family arabinose efflux permease
VLVVFLVRIVGFSSGTTGILLAMTSLGGVAGALLARRAARWLGTARAVVLGRLILTPSGLLIPLAAKGPALGLFVLGSVTLIATIVAGNIIWMGWVQSYYPPRLLGRVWASVQVFNYGSIPLGALLAGALASHLGVRATLWMMLIGLVAVSFVMLIGPLRRLRDLPAAAPPAPVSAREASR